MLAQDHSLADVLGANARRHAGRTAFVEDNQSITHADLWQRCGRIARGLHEAGVGRGDRIAILSHNRLEFMLLIAAAARVGAVVSGINWRLSAQEVALVIANDQPKLVLAENALWPLLDAALAVEPSRWEPLCIGDSREGFRSFLDLELDGEVPALPLGADDPLLMIHTAWLDGQPRAAVLSHRNVLAQAAQLHAVWKLDEHDVHLCVLPLFHVTALALTFATLLAGGSSVLMAKFEPTVAADTIQKHLVSVMGEFAPMLEGLLGVPDAALKLVPLRHLCGLDSPGTIERFAKASPKAKFWSGYGQSEASGLATLAPFREAEGSMGWPLPLTAVEIVDESGTPVAAGVLGEITLRGPCVFQGYWQREADNLRVFRSGRLHTGDTGRVDGRGRLHYVGRLAVKELIKTGGENVYPGEVEAVLRRHPQVADAAVIGVPDASWGESVRAICVTRSEIDAQALIDFVGEQIAHFKRPRSVVFAPELPARADGSHDREKIRSLFGG